MAQFKLVIVHIKPIPSSVVGLGDSGVIDVLLYPESDLKKIAVRVVETTKELCASSTQTNITYEVVEGDTRYVPYDPVEV